MSKPSNNVSETDRLQMSEPTKYIVRCCEMRKRRMVKTTAVPSVQRLRVSFEH